MQHRNSFAGGFSGAILTLIFIAIIFIIFQFQFRSVLKAAPNDKGIVRLRWTAPGDDGNIGRASKYDIRYSLDSITDKNWDSAIQVESEPAPHIAGTEEFFIVTGLELNREYYFGIKTADEVYNWSGISNIVRATANNTYLCGDVSGEGVVNVSDAIVIINYVFLGGEIPVPLQAGDTNCDGSVNVSDAVYIANFVFLGSSPPCDVNQDGIPDC